MRTHRPNPERAGLAWRFWAAVVCLAAWVLATPALVPAVACVLGGLDGQHEVSVGGGRYATIVVLHHEGGGPKPQHRHSLLSGILAAFSQSDRDTQDHLLVFPRSESALSEDSVVSVESAARKIPRPIEVTASLLTLEQKRAGDVSQRGFVPSWGMPCPRSSAQAARVLRI